MRNETPEEKRLRIARLELGNAENAVRDLPTVEARAQERADDVRRRLDEAEAELRHVREVEAPATTARVDELRAEITSLEELVGPEAEA